MRIKELIKEKGFTQKEFADKLGMTTVGLAQILSSGKPSYTTLEKIASALNVNVWELLVSREDVIVHQDPKDTTIKCPKCGEVIHLDVNVKED